MCSMQQGAVYLWHTSILGNVASDKEPAQCLFTKETFRAKSIFKIRKFYRPGVAGAVLQTGLYKIKWSINSCSFSKLSPWVYDVENS